MIKLLLFQMFTLLGLLNWTPECSGAIVKRQADSIVNHDRVIEYGSSVLITCDLTTVYGDQLQWRKHDGVVFHFPYYFPHLKHILIRTFKILNVNSRQENGRLFIPFVSLADTGSYECFTPDGQAKRINLVVKSVIDESNELFDQSTSKFLFFDQN